MKLTLLITRICDLAEKHNMSYKKVYDLVELQDFKRMYRGNESDMELSYRVVERYIKSGKTYEGLLEQLNARK